MRGFSCREHLPLRGIETKTAVISFGSPVVAESIYPFGGLKLFKAIAHVTQNAVDKQTLQLFQKTLVEIAFLLGVGIERWQAVQLYKYDGGQYIKILNVAPRSPN